MARSTVFALTIALLLAAALCVRAGSSEWVYAVVGYLMGPAGLAALLQRDT